MSQVQAVMFDCYSTLVHIRTNDQKDEVYRHLANYLRYYGLNLTPDCLRSLIQNERRHCAASSREHYPEIDLETVFRNILQREHLAGPFLAGSCVRLFRALSLEKLEVYPDTISVLKEMKGAGYRLAVVSDAQKAFCFEEGQLVGLAGFFDRMVVSTQYGFTKPDTRLFKIALELLGVEAEEAVYVGNDPEKDIVGARAAGMRAVLINRGDERWQNKTESMPDFETDSLTHAWEWVKKQ